MIQYPGFFEPLLNLTKSLMIRTTVGLIIYLQISLMTYSFFIRPLRVSLLAYHEQPQKSWGFPFSPSSLYEDA